MKISPVALLQKVNELRSSLDAGAEAHALHGMAEALLQEMLKLQYPRSDGSKEQPIEEAVDACKLGAQSVVLLVQRILNGEDAEHAVSELCQTLDELHFLLSELGTYDSEDKDLTSEAHLALEEVQRSVAAVADTTKIVDLTSRFKTLVESVEKLERATSKFPFSATSEVLKSHIYCLKLSLPVLCKSMQQRINSPGYEVESTNLIEETEKNVEKARTLLQTNAICDSNQLQAGHFVLTMDKLLESLNNQQLQLQMFERNINTVLKHATVVSEFSSNLYNEDIQSVCNAIEDGKKEFCQLLDRSATPDTDTSSIALNDQREFLIENLLQLEKMVNEAIIYIVVDVLSEPRDKSDIDSVASDINLACHLALASCTESDHIVEISSASNRANLLWRLIKIVVPNDKERLMKEWDLTVTKLTWSLDRTINLLLFVSIIEELVLDEYYEINHSTDAARGLFRILLLANRVVQAADMKQLQSKEFAVLLRYLKSALILLKELSARPLNREELKFRIGVLHTCMVSLRRWLEVGGRKRALRNPPSMVGNPETVMHPIVQDITSTPHASLDDEDLPDGVCRILSRAPIQFPPRSTPELLNNARSIETPQTFPELITDDAELRDLIRQALDGYQTRVNLLGNDVVSRSNKLVILVKRVAAALSEEEIKSTLENGAKELTEVSARLLEAVDLVVHGDTTAISTMYECANHWTSLLTELQSNLLPLLEPWMSIVNPVIQNAEGGQFQELPYALSEFSACWGRLDFVFKELELAIDKSFVDPSAHQCVRAIEADRRQMEEEAKQLSDEANKVVVNNVSLRGAAESWSASALCLHLDLVRLFRILTLGSSLSGLKNSPQLRPNQVERVSRYCLLESGRMYAMKEDLSRVERGSKHEMNRLEEGIQNVNQILSILDSEQRSVEAAITDGVRLGSIERYWTVACQIIAEGTTFDHFVDRIVEEFSKPGLRLIGAGIAANSDPDEASNDYYVLRQHFTSKWIEARGEILSIIEDTDMNLRAEIRVVTDELGSLSSRLTDQTDTLCHVCTEDGMKECLTTTRRWACKMDLLINALLLGHGNRAKISVLVKQLCASLSHIRMEYYENIAQRKWTEFRHSNLIHNERETGVNTHRLPTKLKRKSSQPSRTENPNPIRFPRITNSTTFDKIASVLEHATDKWEDDQNEIVQVAKEMSRKLSDLLGYMRGEGPLQTRDELLFNAREIATDASQMIDFAKIIAKFATSEEFRQRLNCQANLIAMPAAQLSIVARVKESFSLDSTSVRQVATTAENLMRAVAHTLQAAEACCVHGLNATGASPVEKEALAVTSRWVSRLQHHYRRQASQSRVDDLGLRRISLNQAAPNLSDMFLQR